MGERCELPQWGLRKSNLVHFVLKIWHLVATVLIILLGTNWPNLYVVCIKIITVKLTSALMCTNYTSQSFRLNSIVLSAVAALAIDRPYLGPYLGEGTTTATYLLTYLPSVPGSQKSKIKISTEIFNMFNHMTFALLYMRERTTEQRLIYDIIRRCVTCSLRCIQTAV